MLDFVLSLVLTISEGIPTDFGTPELMIFGGPPYSERLLNPPQDVDLSQQLLDFAARRPYAKDIPDWWRAAYQSTKEIAQKIQELEELNSILPPISDSYIFPDSQHLQDEVEFAQGYYKNLAEQARFMLKEEQDAIEGLIFYYYKIRLAYYGIISSRYGTLSYIDRRKYLQEVKDIIPGNLYYKGILPKLIPNTFP